MTTGNEGLPIPTAYPARQAELNSSRRRNQPLIIGHRGASTLAPENTMIAFNKAIDCGADGIEFDVRLSRDGIPVVIHDNTLRRTGLRPERVGDLTVQELKTVDAGSWFSKIHHLGINQFAKEPIPTLEELLNQFAANSAILYLELKPLPEEIERMVSVTAAMLEGHPVCDRVVIECFNLTCIKEVKRVAPDIKTAALFEARLKHVGAFSSGSSLIAHAKSAGADEIALHHRLAGKRTIGLARDAGFPVVVWTVDDPIWLARAREYGIHALITNDPALLLGYPTDGQTV